MVNSNCKHNIFSKKLVIYFSYSFVLLVLFTQMKHFFMGLIVHAAGTKIKMAMVYSINSLTDCKF